MTIPNNFSRNLKYLRENKKIDRYKLAEDLSKDYSTIGKWESGTRSPTMQDTLEVCDYFQIDLSDLILKDLKMEDLKIEENVYLDENHKLDTIIMDNLKELTEDDKQKIIGIMDIIKGSDSNK